MGSDTVAVSYYDGRSERRVTSTTPLPTGAVDSAGNALDYSEPLQTQLYLVPTSPLTAVIINDATSAGDASIAAATAGQTTKLYALRLRAAGTVTVTLKRGSTTLEVFLLAAGIEINLPYRGTPYHETAANETMVLTLSADIQVHGVAEIVTSV